MYSRLLFNPQFKFFDEYDQFATMWSNNGISTPDDNDLIKAIRTTYLTRMIASLHSRDQDWLEVMNRRRQNHGKAGPFTKQFLAFNVTTRSKNIKIHINRPYDWYAVSSLCKQNVHRGKIDPSTYLGLGKKIRQKISADKAELFINSSLYSILPKWSTEEIKTFLANLPGVTNTQHTNTVKRLVARSTNYHKSIGDSYLSRLIHAKKNLVEAAEGANLKLMPRSFPSNSYRAYLFYLMTHQSNCLQDIQKAFLASLVPVDNYRDFNFLYMPITYRKTGIGFHKILQEIVNVRIGQFDWQKMKPLAARIIDAEIRVHQDQRSSLKSFRSEDVCFVDLNKLDSTYSEKDKKLLCCPGSFVTVGVIV